MLVELECQIFDSVAVVIDMNFINGVFVEKKIVRTAVGILQRLVVGDEGYKVRAGGFIAAEHIEVRAVDLRTAGDERGFTVA